MGRARAGAGPSLTPASVQAALSDLGFFFVTAASELPEATSALD